MARNNDFSNDELKSRLQKKTARARRRRTTAVEIDARTVAPRRNDLLPDQVVETLPVAALRPAHRRARSTTPERLLAIMDAIRVFGQTHPILIDDDRHVVCGHVVWAAMKELGQERINCIVLHHLTADERRAYAIADARLGETGSWDLDALKIELSDLADIEVNLDVLGFTPQQLDIIITDDDAEREEAEPDTPADTPIVSSIGDCFLLGRHRIICGNALEPATYKNLMGDDRAAVVVSDAPYNCPIENFVSGLGAHRHVDFSQAVGEMTDEEFERFLGTYLDNCKRHCSDGAVIFAFMDWRQIDILLGAGKRIGLKRLQVVVWNKGVGAMGSLYRSAHEFCAVFCNGNSAATNNIELGRHGRDRTNVWSYPGATRRGSSAAEALKDHPTPKPVEMIADALRDVSKRGDIVLDPFLGSGTTIMAAEASRRIAYGIELEGKYVDRAIRRWESKTGRQAIHVATNLTFSELAQRRAAERQTDTALLKLIDYRPERADGARAQRADHGPDHDRDRRQDDRDDGAAGQPGEEPDPHSG